jgi:hypothetical protein
MYHHNGGATDNGDLRQHPEGPLDRLPALRAAPWTRSDSLGAFLVAGATWAADSPQNLPATLETRPESFRLWASRWPSGLAFVVW